ncbi:CHAT domain-containing protein [Oscillatoriales cyanobacterium LEGE 11467]|uniref:CHAT domain-containing protein n=1 Tax=Zarconia navalis LEGE 11467 TaxID=1828826 RepID=A0A928VTR3_9CYAN|nr:CHAT domain-containing protein [Zarconia navalis]MBE9040107.1 CHAT domain-containing protein [Zarconia navalis LEGE 11467]
MNVRIYPSLLLSTFLWTIAITNDTSAFAQPITPANDGTGTIVTPDGDRIDIHGGQRSSDGSNLFHSFDRFGLDGGQTANFLADPNLSNILGRVTGGDASFINGLLQVSGGDANLFLVNPAGIVFGPSAALNVPADFTATTATGIGFGGNSFGVFEDNNWSELVGTPDRLEFTIADPGAIVNAGYLAVTPANNLNLLAGTIVNTGTLQASGGNITVAAVPGESLVRLSAKDNLLSLEVEPTSNAPLDFTPLSLPQLLSGGEERGHATSIAVNPDGTLSLLGSDAAIASQTGDAIVSGTVDVSNAADSVEGFPATVRILGDRIGLFDATLDASGTNGGGNIFIGGNFRGQGPLPNARVTFVDAGTSIFADALYQGDGGQVILWADDTTQFFGNISARGAALSTSNILSGDLSISPSSSSSLSPSSSHGGFVEVSGKQNLIFRGTVDTRAPHGNLGTLLLDPENITIVDGSGDGAGDGTTLFAGDIGGSDGQILAGDSAPVTIYESELEALDGNTNIILEAKNNITIEDLSDNRLVLNPGNGSVTFIADSDGVDGGSFSMNSGDIIFARGRDFSISGTSIVLGSIDTSVANGDVGDGGDITLLSSGGDITTGGGSLRSKSDIGDGGDITLIVQSGSITTADIFSFSNDKGTGGDIILTVREGGGQISIGGLQSYSELGTGGNITVTTASGDILASNNLLSFSRGTGNAGDVTLRVREGGGRINVQGTIASSQMGDGGNLSLFTESSDIDLGGNWIADTQSDGHAGNIVIEIGGATGSFNIEDSKLLVNAHSDNIGNGGAIDIRVPGNITANEVSATGGDNGGGIIIFSGGTLTVGDVLVGADVGNGGAIELRASGNIITGNISSAAGMNGGLISLVSENGSINTSGSVINAIGGESGGNIFIDSALDITLGGVGNTAILNPGFNRNSGSIHLRSNDGSIEISGPLFTVSALGRGGDINFDAEGDIILNEVNTRSFSEIGGAIELSSEGKIELSQSIETNQNNITFNAPVILTNDVIILSLESGNTYFHYTIDGAHNLTVNSQSGNIQIMGSVGSNTPLESIEIRSHLDNDSNPIDITTTGNITAQDLESKSGIDLSSRNGDITADILDTSSLGNSGNISLDANNIQLDGINTTSRNGTGGDVSIEVGNLRVTDSFLDLNGIDASLSTAGATGGGTIVIRHRGNGEIPFIVGDASQNGTDGAITRGNGYLETIFSGEFLYTYTQDGGRIGIISIPAPMEIDEMEENENLEESSEPDISENLNEIESDTTGDSEPDNLEDEDSFNAIDPIDSMAESSDSTLDTDEGINSMSDGNGIANPIAGEDRANNPNGNEPGGAIVNPTHSDNGIEDRANNPNGNEPGDAIVNPTHPGNSINEPNFGPMDGGNDIDIPNPTDDQNDLDRSNPDLTSDVSDRNSPPDKVLREELAREIATSLNADLSLGEDEVTWKLPDPKQDISLKLDLGNFEGGVAALDRFFEEQIEEEAGDNLNEDERSMTAQVVRETLKTIELETGKRAVIVYALTLPQTQAFPTQTERASDRHREQLTLVLVVPEGPPIVKTVDLESGQLKRTLKLLRQSITAYQSQSYLPSSQQLYQWLIQPLDEHLEALDIDTLIFAMDAGLHQLPLAALHDGDRFLIERYSLGSIPSLSLTDTRYRSLEKMQVLAMGASEFPESNNPSLPAVPLELALVSGNSSRIPPSTQGLQEGEGSFFDRNPLGRSFLNEEFTLENLIEQRQKQPFDIIHLATHANFDPQNHYRAYLELWDRRVALDELRLVEWYAPPIVELLVLSACETAVGDREAELGFAGLAVRAGVKSVLASLWQVKDTGTLVMMSQFYHYLQEAPIKAEALRQAQLALLRGEASVRDGYLVGNGVRIPLPPETGNWEGRDFSHPYFWSGFTLVGSPW